MIGDALSLWKPSDLHTFYRKNVPGPSTGWTSACTLIIMMPKCSFPPLRQESQGKPLPHHICTHKTSVAHEHQLVCFSQTMYIVFLSCGVFHAAYVEFVHESARTLIAGTKIRIRRLIGPHSLLLVTECTYSSAQLNDWPLLALQVELIPVLRH